MSGGFGGFVSDIAGSFTDFASDFVTDFTTDFGLDSFTNGFGTEFLTDVGATVFDFGGDLFTAGGEFFGDIGGTLYEQVGSFAGNADWFNATSFGSIVDSATSGISEFFGDATGFVSSGVSSLTTGITSYLPNAVPTSLIPNINLGAVLPAASAVIGSATGINPALVGTAIGAVTGTPTRTSGSPIGINPNLIPGFGGGGLPVLGVGSILSTPGFGSTAGYGTPSILPSTGINYNSLLNSGLSLVSGSTTALAAPRANNLLPGAVNNFDNALTIDITGVGINPAELQNAPVNLGGNIARADSFAEIFNPETGLYDVYNLSTNETVVSGLSQQQAILTAQEFDITEGITLDTDATPLVPNNLPAFDDDGNLLPGYELDEDGNPIFVGFGAFNVTPGSVNPNNFPGYDDEGNLLPGYELDEENNPVFVGGGISAGTGTNPAGGEFQGLLDQARQQQTIRDQRMNKASAGDWRVRLRLAPNSNYLYNSPDCGPVLWPLRQTDGVIFPYTPNIDTAYKANYTPYDLTHSNYRGYFYQGSYVDAINIRAQFTAQDTAEANYLLGVITFFKSVTKMFYGQDSQRGAPPPLVYLNGLGDYQFNEHPCVVSQFNYTLPSDVDYIRAQVSNDAGTNLLVRRDRQNISNIPLVNAVGRIRKLISGLTDGAEDNRVPPNTLGVKGATYVPTKMEISLTLFPIQSRQQVSKQFSVKNFANGNLLRGGFW